MERPNGLQIAAATAILKKHTAQYGASASDTMLSMTALSIFSALGGVGEPAAEYKDVVAQATGGDIKVKPTMKSLGNGEYAILQENVLGLPVGTYVNADMFDDDDEEQPDAELPDDAALGRMNKAELAAQAAKEAVEATGTNAEMVAAILAGRGTGDGNSGD